MIYNRKHRTFPALAHAPGRREYIPLWDQLVSYHYESSVPTVCPADLAVVTFNNGQAGYNGKGLGMLERTLVRAGVPHVVLGRGLVRWRNADKIGLLLEFLGGCRSPFVLVADSGDVALANRLEAVPEELDRSGCEALFNGEKLCWPKHPTFEAFEAGQNSYLNAGLWVAKRDFAVELVRFCAAVRVPPGLEASEQARYKCAYPVFKGQMAVDHTCRLFQGLNRVDRDEVLIAPKIF